MTADRDKALDGFKGILICLIVVGHNYFFSRNFPNLFSFIYGFHVISFLLFPFLFLKTCDRKKTLFDKLFRILVPHFTFMIIAGAVFVIVHVIWGDMTLLVWLKGAGKVLLTQRETPFRQYFGTGLFWFLPALAVQSVLVFCYLKSLEQLKLLFIVIALLWHGCIGFFDSSFIYQMPFSFSLVSYIFFLGLTIHFIHQRVVWSIWASLFLIIAWLFCSWLAFEFRFFHLIAGDLYRPPVSIATPVELLLQDGMILLSFFALLRFAYLLKSNILAFIGRYSLQIFLIHSFVWQLLWRSGLKYMETNFWMFELAIVALSFVATMLITISLAKMIEKSGFQPLIFPRRITDWKQFNRR